MLTEEQFSYLAKKYMDMVFRLALHYTKSRSESDLSLIHISEPTRRS